MRNSKLSVLILGIALMLLGYFLKLNLIVSNNILMIAGLLLVALALAQLVYKALKK